MREGGKEVEGRERQEGERDQVQWLTSISPEFQRQKNHCSKFKVPSAYTESLQ